MSTTSPSKKQRHKRKKKAAADATSSRGAQASPSPADWEAWSRHLATRRRPKPLYRTISGRADVQVRDPLAWGLPADMPEDSRALLHLLQRFVRGKKVDAEQLATTLEEWLAAESPARNSVAAAAGGESPSDLGSSAPCRAWETLAWCHAAPRLPEVLPAAPWNELLDHLLSVAGRASTQPLEDGLLRHQLLAGELPLTLSVLLPEIEACRQLEADAFRNLSWGLCECTDGEGLPHASAMNELRALIACWTRCRYLAPSCFDEDATTQFEWLVRQSLRLCRADGRQVLADERTNGWDKGLFQALLHLAADKDDWTAAERLLPLKRPKGRGGDLPAPSVTSAWSECAVMRPRWSPRSPLFAVRFDHPGMTCELSCGRSLLLAGPWQSTFEVGGRPVDEDSAWEEVCCFSDEDVDYLELERQLSGGWRVQRQMLLARQDGLLLLADALLGEEPGELSCRSRVPLGHDVLAQFARETREGDLAIRESVARILPLALPEWRLETAGGDLTAADDMLEWETSGRGRSLFHPLLFDLNPRRAGKPLTWRRLTVAERRVIQPPDVAIGYRVQIGKAQWLIYRSLMDPGNRTLLGQNYSQEFVMARFQKDGTSEPLIEIETE